MRDGVLLMKPGLRTLCFVAALPVIAKTLIDLNLYRSDLGTIIVAKHRLFVWIASNVIPDHRLIVFAREDDYFFGVLHSRAHERWSLATCSWQGVGNDPVYTPQTCFETVIPRYCGSSWMMCTASWASSSLNCWAL